MSPAPLPVEERVLTVKKIKIDIDVKRAIEAGRVDFDEGENDILRRLLGIDRKPAVAGMPRQRLSRSSGAYSTTLGKKAIEANSLKELLRRAILICEQEQAGFVERLGELATARGRHIVARSATELYPRAPQLIDYAERLSEGWWYDTNVGRSQVTAYLKLFASLLKLPTLPTIEKRVEKSSVTAAELGLPEVSAG